MKKIKQCILPFGGVVAVGFLQTEDMDMTHMWSDDEDLMCPYCGEIIQIRPKDGRGYFEGKFVSHCCSRIQKIADLQSEKFYADKNLEEINRMLSLLINDFVYDQVGDDLFKVVGK